MSDWNNSTAEERIGKWRELREHIKSLPEEEQLNSIAEFFARVPIGSRCVDFYTPASWPTPWELLYHKLFCASSISLLIYHTLVITLDEDRVDIILINTGDDVFLAPLVDKKHIFNIELGKVNNITDYPKIEIIDDFTDQEIHQVQ
jgi:hypothetical protein